jgi:solute carrier family 13 (sodium-dependent dicarboxylate transporter), member 2/3/5
MANRKSTSQRIGLILGPLLFIAVSFMDLQPGNPVATRMAAVALLMATWWITEAIPLFATALLPLILYPLLGIAKGGATAPIYFNSTIVLFLGGFMIALTMERWNLHRRIALMIIQRVGGGPARLTLGFMVAAAFLSMWISNTATAIMMVPIGLAIIMELEKTFGEKATHPFSVGVMLAIGYACSVGGLVTLVGTPPNLSFIRIYQITFPDAEAISFGQWILLGLPISIVLLLSAWLLITKVFFRVPKHITIDPNVVRKQVRDLGKISYEEIMVLAVFISTAMLWTFRVPITLGGFTIPGWSTLLPHADLLDDGTVAILMASLLFLIPSRSPQSTSPTLAGPEIIPRLPWNIVLLFGGGFALAFGFQETGLAEYIGNQFSGLAGVSPVLLILVICLSLTFLTELTSNTATTEMILPILASVAVAAEIHPLMLMVPATLSASCAFMMPVATPPNAIIFGSNRVRIPEMARVGFVLNIIGVLTITAVFMLIGTKVLNIT